MRTGKLRWAVGAVSVMVVGSVAGAQSAEPACSVGFSNYHGYGISRKLASPFTLTAKSTFEQRLPDGSYVRGYLVTHGARDGAGRIRSEMATSCRRDENGVPEPQLQVNIDDPVAKTNWHWEVNYPFAAKTVYVTHQQVQPAVARKPMTAEEQAAQRKLIQAQQPPRSETKREDLGVRTIAGVEARGTRNTRTIPAGEEGNELPLVVIDETWHSRDLNMILMAIADDPRRGRSTYEVEELTAGEPDASLFEPPAGYKIVDTNPPADGAANQ